MTAFPRQDDGGNGGGRGVDRNTRSLGGTHISQVGSRGWVCTVILGADWESQLTGSRRKENIDHDSQSAAPGDCLELCGERGYGKRLMNLSLRTPRLYSVLRATWHPARWEKVSLLLHRHSCIWEHLSRVLGLSRWQSDVENDDISKQFFGQRTLVRMGAWAYT